MRQPAIYLPHGGGPCFFMKSAFGPPGTWDGMEAYLRGLSRGLPERPRALLIVSAHWETRVPTLLAHASPGLYYDYYGFPPHTYELSWPAPCALDVAARAGACLAEAGIDHAVDTERGYDHGVFIPMLLAFPEADVPVTQLSLRADLDARAHFAIGRALAKLRDEGVLIVGSGMSYHNMRPHPEAARASARFDDALRAALTPKGEARNEALAAYVHWPETPICHPRPEHLTPLFVVAGAGENEDGTQPYRERVLGATVSAFHFG